MKSSNQETSNLLLKKPTDHKCSSKFLFRNLIWYEMIFIPYQSVKRNMQAFCSLFVTQCFTPYQNALENVFKFGETVSLCSFHGRNSSPNTSFSFVYTNKISVESANVVIQTGQATLQHVTERQLCS